MWNLNDSTSEPIYKQKQTHRHREQTSGYIPFYTVHNFNLLGVMIFIYFYFSICYFWDLTLVIQPYITDEKYSVMAK